MAEQESHNIDTENLVYLNQDAGALSKDLGIISEETERLVGAIQERLLATAILYQNGDEELQTTLEDANLIIDDIKDEKVIGKKVNGDILFDLRKEVENEAKEALEPEAKLTAIDTKLDSVIKTAMSGETSKYENARQDAHKIVDAKEGVQDFKNGRPFVTPANMIAALGATKTSNQFRDAILPVQVFLRSNYLDFPTGGLGLNEKDFEFNIPTKPFFDDNVKEVIDAGRRMAEAHAAGEAPNQQDVEIVENGLDITLKNLEEIDHDVSAYTARIEQIKAEAQALSWDGVELENSEPKTTPLSLSTSGKTEETEDNNGGGDAPDPVDPAEHTRDLAKFLNAIQEANKAPIPASFDAAKANGNAQWLADVLDPKEVKQGKAVFEDNVQGHRISVTPDKIEHIDNDGNFSFQEALQFITLASANPKMMDEGITINGGTPQEQAMLVVAAKFLEASGQTVPTINNLDQIDQNLVNQIAQVAEQGFTQQGLLDQNGLQFANFARNNGSETTPEPETPENKPADSESENATNESTEEDTADASDAPNVGDTVSEEKPETPAEDEIEVDPALASDLGLSEEEPDNTATDFGTEVEEGTESPSADDVQKEFTAKSALPEGAYEKVVEHVREVGKARNVDIRDALKGQGIDFSDFGAAFNEAKELLKQEDFIDEVPHAANTRLVVKDDAPKPAQA